MPEQQYGPQILLEAQALYQAMKVKTNYNRREISDLITQHVPSISKCAPVQDGVIVLGFAEDWVGPEGLHQPVV